MFTVHIHRRLSRGAFFPARTILLISLLLCAILGMQDRGRTAVSAQEGETGDDRNLKVPEDLIRQSQSQVIATITEGGVVYAVGIAEETPFKTRIFQGAIRSFGLRDGWLAYTEPMATGIGEQLIIRNLKTHESLTPLPEEALGNAEWNPVKAQLAAIVSGGNDFRLTIFDLSGRNVAFPESKGVGPELLRWDREGRRVSFIERGNEEIDPAVYLTEADVSGELRTRREIGEKTVPTISMLTNAEVDNLDYLVARRMDLDEQMATEVENTDNGGIRLHRKNKSDSREDILSARRTMGGLLVQRMTAAGNVEYCVISAASGKIHTMSEIQTNYLQASAQTAQATANEEGLVGAWYLSFPLGGYNAYSEVLNSVMDHSVPKGWYSKNLDQIVTGFTGEEGAKVYGYWSQSSDLYKQQSGGAFSLKGTYTGGNWGKQYLSYDGHPGIDYRAASGTPILAPADGNLYIPSSDNVNGSVYGCNTFVIDHGNGYSTWYLHSQRGSIVKSGPVKRGQPVAKVGTVGTDAPHLHFEVRRSGIPVDPYGWEGGCKDPYRAAINRNLWTNSGTSWQFDTTGNAQGWESVNTECFSVHSGAFWVDPAGDDPYIRSLPLVNVKASDFNTVEINIFSGAPDGRAAIYFTTDSAPDWNETNKVTFPVSNNRTWQRYNVRMDDNSSWKGMITGLRIDPSDGGWTATGSDTVGFDLIRLKWAAATVTPVKATMTSPTPGSTFSSSTVTFNWSTGSGVTEYFLYVGTAFGGNDIYGWSLAMGRSATVSGIPTDGRTIYVRLWSKLGGTWDFVDYQYTAFRGGSTLAQMISPTPGSTFNSSTVTFSWTSGSYVSQYWLYLGTTPGGYELYSQSQGMNRSKTIYGLPVNGQPIYVTLWSYTSSGWNGYIYTYRARY